MSPAGHSNISDAKLVAYIDGELSIAEHEGMARALAVDSEARERLARLTHGGRAFADAFDVLLDAAPGAQLQAMFDGLLAKQVRPAEARGRNVTTFRKPPPPSIAAPLWHLAAAAAVGALVLTGGLFAGGFLNAPSQQQQLAEQKPTWREAAARYVALFSADTLAGMPADQETRQLNLQRAAQALGLNLSADKIANPALLFQGTQLLQFQGKPLGQFSYLYPDGTPVVLCIIKTANPAHRGAEEQRQGLNIVHWVAGGYGFMVISKAPAPALRKISATFRAQLS
jgi:anti-sigma factor RsiW